MQEIIYRTAVASIFLAGISISVYFRRKADHESGEQIPRKVDGSLLMNIIRIGGLILWISPLLYIINPSWMVWSKLGLPEPARWIGIGVGVFCPLLIYWLFSSIESNISPTSATRQKHQLITKGPYRWVRHPLYTIGTLNFTALGLIADNWFIILLGILAFVVMAIRTPQEEANLIEKFGEAYEDYMKRTGRFLPRFP